MAESIFEKKLKPSSTFLSLYGPDGVLPIHVDRPPFLFTIDFLINSDDKWPLYIESKPYVMAPGDAVCYLGTEQPHFRKPMASDSSANFCDLAFFQFVPVDWKGPLD